MNSWLISSVCLPWLQYYPSVYLCDFTRALSLCISDVNDLYYTNIVFVSDVFSYFKNICDLSHESICLRWHPYVNDCVEYLVFEANLSTSTGSHLNATCINHVTYLRSFVTRELFDRTISEVKVEVVDMCLFLFLHILIISRFFIHEHGSNVLVFACRCCSHDGDGFEK